ncbi:hypothetical protein CHS0354_026358 [Potamilus streckersoni]|uniref:Mitochondria-eating protein C-terminal domain-containing protein n=1 Tax=Potamilus streckersoni TaxID=2493646 RepID=A0AAE0W723_9BIVA|nr:hypothetical protein CHS0354_026358 [Potamilus streckersoni]
MVKENVKRLVQNAKRLLKEARKHIDIKQVDNLHKNAMERTIIKGIEIKYLNETLVQIFAKECFQLCWLMSIQDPPIVLEEIPLHGSFFDTSMYKQYVNSGNIVEHVV